MTLRELQYLVEVARLGNFRRAAEVCNVSQPTLSAQLRKLEDELGVVLVERGARRVILTAAGEEILGPAQRMLAEANDIRTLAARHRSPDTGRLRLGAFHTLGPYLLPRLVPRIGAAFPGLELELVEEKSAQLLEKLRAGRLDVALLALPVAEGYQVEPLFTEEFFLAVPAGHPLAARNSVQLSELGGQRLMLLEDGHCLRDQALNLCQRWGAEETAGFRASSLETLRQMVSAGMGITLLPALATRGPLAQAGALRFLPVVDDPAPSRTIGLVWRRSSALAPLLRDLAALIRATAAEITAAA